MSMKSALCLLVMLSGCAGLPQVTDRLDAVGNAAVEAIELVQCDGLRISTYLRHYGNTPARAAAWKELCSKRIENMP